MKALVVYDPKSKFTLDALKAVEYKLAELENLELVYVADHNHERMENPKEYNLKMEKEGPEWITPEPEVMEQIKDADILMTSFILKVSPIGVFCLMSWVVAAQGPKILGSLGLVLLAAYIGSGVCSSASALRCIR